ncbi:MAG: [protein-PII] uridylyltransferase [Chthoniobacterales bacterium]|nr:[protein-PII] uridylyltransferase [Chthoniobacterales bacterium]
MLRHLAKVLAHAEQQLAPAGAARPTDVLPLYKKFLRIEEHRLRLKHQASGGGREICARRVSLVDVLLQHVFAAASNFARAQTGAPATPLTLLALGGYGRGELNPFSDVDVMFLHGETTDEVSPTTAQVVEQILYLLWDIGFRVGHSTRSVQQATEQANTDMLTKTAMLESRYLAGDRELLRVFRQRFRADCVDGFEHEYVAMRMADQVARHKKYGDSVYMQEPHIKNGCGGLRDYQNLLWTTFFKEGALTTNQLVGKDWLTVADQRRIEAAYDFLLRIRTDLHYAIGRATDVLHLNFQDEIAKRLGYANRRGQLRSEALMKDYYGHTRNIFRVTERITEQFANATAAKASTSRSTAQEEETKDFGAFSSRQRRLYAKSNEVFRREPELMMRVFQIAQEHHLELSPELEDLLSRSPQAVTRTFRSAKRPREMFRTMLSRKGAAGCVLRMMHRVDFLGRYLPEFAPLTCLVQHEYFHRYTADEHTLVCIEKLDALMTTENPKLRPYRELFEKLEEPFVLYLAILLHDTGKAVGARPHSEASALFAQRAARRLELSPEARRALILLVDHHVTLSNFAQQRNLDDPQTIVEFGQIVRNRKNLDALMLLTLADGQGTSAEGWSDWKETLVWQLYHGTSQYLADRAAFHEHQKIERESLQRAVVEKLSPGYAEEVDAQFEFMPDNYLRAFGVPEIASHARLFRQFLENLYLRGGTPLVPASHWVALPSQGHSVVSFCTWDWPHLLAKIAGAFAVVPLNILSADIFTRGDNVVLDIFHVCDRRGRAVTDEGERASMESTLRQALTDPGFDFEPLLEKTRWQPGAGTSHDLDFPTRIITDNKSHPSHTLVQVETADRPALLYDLLSVMQGEGISIALARISTDKGAAIDTFYVTDATTRGKIMDGERIKALQQKLHRAAVREQGDGATAGANGSAAANVKRS